MKTIYAIVCALCFGASAFAIGNIGGGNGGYSLPFNLLVPGIGGQPTFAATNAIIAGSIDDNGNFQASPVSPADYFSGVAYNLDSNSFAILGDTIYSKGLIGGGSVVVLQTNIAAKFASFSFTTNSRLIIGVVPSYIKAVIGGQVSAATGANPPTQAFPQISRDGGATWLTATSSTSPVIVSLYNNSGNNDTATNVTVYGYVAPDNVGKTNDFGGQVVFADMKTGDVREIVNRAGAATIAANAAAQWASSPAVAPVNLNGYALTFNATWTAQPIGSALDFGGVLKLTPKITSSGSNAYIAGFTVTSNLTFKIQANGSNTPSIFYCTNLISPSWSTLTQSSNWTSGGYFFITAAKPAAAQSFFKATATVATNNAAVTVTGDLSATSFTGSGVGLTFTNAAGKKFSLVVNASTNGFNFVAQP